MATVSLATITALEREAMAGLLQLQAQRVQENPHPTPQIQPSNMNDDMQTVTAAWVLTRCFSPNGTSPPYEPMATQSWITEVSRDSDSSHSSGTQTYPLKTFTTPNRNHNVFLDSNSRISVCCCYYTHSSSECNGCILNVQMRDVGIQTDSSACPSPDAKSDESSEESATSRLERLICVAMKRNKNVSLDLALSGPSMKRTVSEPVIPIVPVIKEKTPARDNKAKTPVDNKRKTPTQPKAITPTHSKPKTPMHTRKSQFATPVKYSQPLETEDFVDSDDEDWSPAEFIRKSKQQRRRFTSFGSNKENMDVSGFSDLEETTTGKPIMKSDQDLVPIGDGNAKIPARLLKHMNWASYTNVTRKLLTAVFPRSVLATHSLTGKPSPAFPNKPAKKKLDPALVNDIVQTVVEKCGVPENVVRTSITTKCADESKMFRTRQRNKKMSMP